MLKKLSYNLSKPGLTELLALLVFIVFIPSFFVSDEIMNGTRMAKEFGLSITLAIVLPIALILWTIYNWKDLSIGITKIDILVAIFAAYCGFLVWHHGYTDRIEIKFFIYGSAYILFRMFFSSFKKNTHPEYSWKNPRVYFPVLLSLILSAHCIIGLLQLYGVMNSYHTYFKVTGMFFNPAPYAGFLIALSPFCIATYMEMKRHKEKWGKGEKVAANLLMASFLLTVFVLPVTQSRAAWVAFAGAMAFLVWKCYPVKEWWAAYFPKTWMKVTGISLAAVIMVSTAAGLYYYKKDSADGRLLIWSISSKLTSNKNLLFGNGLGSFAAQYMKEQEKSVSLMRNELTYIPNMGYIVYPYNEILRTYIEIGLIGVLLLIYIIYYHIKIGKIYSIIIVAIIIYSLFSYPVSIPSIMLLLILWLTNDSQYFIYSVRIDMYLYSIVVLIFILLIATTVHKSSNYYYTYKDWFQANQLYKKGLYNQSYDRYSKCFAKLHTNGEYLIAFAKLNNILKHYELSNEFLELASPITYNSLLLNTKADNFFSMGKAEMAIKYYKKSSFAEPNKIYPQYRLATLYFELKRYDLAVELSNRIINYNIKVNSNATLEMKSNLRDLVNKFNSKQ